jgi:hypothetical protein
MSSTSKAVGGHSCAIAWIGARRRANPSNLHRGSPNAFQKTRRVIRYLCSRKKRDHTCGSRRLLRVLSPNKSTRGMMLPNLTKLKTETENEGDTGGFCVEYNRSTFLSFSSLLFNTGSYKTNSS